MPGYCRNMHETITMEHAIELDVSWPKAWLAAQQTQNHVKIASLGSLEAG